MHYTSAEANKLLKQLKDEWDNLRLEEEQSCVFTAATVEKVDEVRPEYGFLEMQERLSAVEDKIRTVKHAMNLFNTSHTIPGTEITIDEALVLIPQLSAKKVKLAKMCNRLPKSRKRSAYGEKSNFIEYEYANYNIGEAKEMYDRISERLAALQLGLDKVNATELMKIEI